jgi:NAD(P)-dependent dehydrogenase (short-subunit alcohol dehydrogenase family)
MARLSRRWLITGVSSGLGRSLARAALEQGDTVAGTIRDRANAGDFEALAPGRAHALRIDLREGEKIAEMVEEAVRRLGGLDCLVNNAGYALAGAIEEISLKEARELFETNFFAPLAIGRAALPHLRWSDCGRIINISSMAALQGFRGLGLYCASKAALAALSEVLAIEAAPFGIRTTCVEAAALRTRFAGGSLVFATAELPEYRAMREEMKAAFARSHGSQPNHPDQAALTLLALTRMADPPVHFAIGHGAWPRIERLLADRREEYARFAELGASPAASERA